MVGFKTHMASSFQKDQHHFSFEKCLNEFAEHFQILSQIQNVQPNLYTVVKVDGDRHSQEVANSKGSW